MLQLKGAVSRQAPASSAAFNFPEVQPLLKASTLSYYQYTLLRLLSLYFAVCFGSW